MKKRFVVLGIFLALVTILRAQPPGQLIIKGYGNDLHLDHSVAPKEGLFAIGRLYNVHPKTIAAYNNLDMAQGLRIGQVIHIPLTDTNFSQKTSNGIPIYYSIGDKETLQKVSTVNKVTSQNLHSWNKLPNDNLKKGTKLIIGFLVTGENPAVTASVPVKEEPKKVTEEKPLVKKDIVAEKPVAKKEETVEKPVVKKEEPKKEEPKKMEPVVTTQQVTADMTGQGYFKSFFDQQVKATPVSKTEAVTSGIFKMISGPQEAKYYLLMDGIPSGTIIRIINPDNNKTIYAKVLGEMNGIRQNQGLDVRISNIAALTLGIKDTDKFILNINY